MKGLLSLIFLGSFVFCSYGDVENKSYVKNYPSLSRFRRAADSCTNVCTGNEGTVPGTISWLLEIQGGIYLVFDGANNYFGIINININIAITLNGNLGIGALFNFNLGGCIMFNLANMKATFVATASFTIATKSVAFGAFLQMCATLTAQANTITGLSNTLNMNFDFSLLIQGFGTQTSIGNIITGNPDLVTALNKSFGDYFAQVIQAIKIGSSTIGFALGVLLNPLMNVVNTVYSVNQSIINCLLPIMTNLKGKFTIDVFAQFKIAITLSTAAQITTSMNQLANALTVVGTYFVDISAALTAYISNKLPSIAVLYTTMNNIKTKVVVVFSTIQWSIGITGIFTGSYLLIASKSTYIAFYSNVVNYAFLVNIAIPPRACLTNTLTGADLYFYLANGKYNANDRTTVKASFSSGNFITAFDAMATRVMKPSATDFSIILNSNSVYTVIGNIFFNSGLKTNVNTDFTILNVNSLVPNPLGVFVALQSIINSVLGTNFVSITSFSNLLTATAVPSVTNILSIFGINL